MGELRHSHPLYNALTFQVNEGQAAALKDKVFIYKSRGELSLLVHPTIQCDFLAYFDP